MLNNTTLGAEKCNNEGELCYNMSYGTRTCFMRRGDEYLDVNPIYDFAHMPGTTARLETDDQLKVCMDWWCVPLPNDHVGGLTEGDRGIIYERPEHDGITATVSFFATISFAAISVLSTRISTTLRRKDAEKFFASISMPCWRRLWA